MEAAHSFRHPKRPWGRAGQRSAKQTKRDPTYNRQRAFQHKHAMRRQQIHQMCRCLHLSHVPLVLCDQQVVVNVAHHTFHFIKGLLEQTKLNGARDSRIKERKAASANERTAMSSWCAWSAGVRFFMASSKSSYRGSRCTGAMRRDDSDVRFVASNARSRFRHLANAG